MESESGMPRSQFQLRRRATGGGARLVKTRGCQAFIHGGRIGQCGSVGLGEEHVNT